MENKIITVYAVWTEGSGDVFKGYSNNYLGTFKSETKAKEFAKSKHGWVEPETGLYHIDYPFMDS